jgi:hypothetical protein
MKQRRREEPIVPPRYTYRRELSMGELVPAIGAGLAVGAAAFYVATLFLQRTPLIPGPLEPTERLAPRRRSGARTGDDLPPSREGSRAARSTR